MFTFNGCYSLFFEPIKYEFGFRRKSIIPEYDPDYPITCTVILVVIIILVDVVIRIISILFDIPDLKLRLKS